MLALQLKEFGMLFNRRIASVDCRILAWKREYSSGSHHSSFSFFNIEIYLSVTVTCARLMSGLQSSISTHIARNFLNATTNSWGENPDLFMKAVGNHPDRLQVVFEMQ